VPSISLIACTGTGTVPVLRKRKSPGGPRSVAAYEILKRPTRRSALQGTVFIEDRNQETGAGTGSRSSSRSRDQIKTADPFDRLRAGGRSALQSYSSPLAAILTAWSRLSVSRNRYKAAPPPATSAPRRWLPKSANSPGRKLHSESSTASRSLE